MKYKKCNLKGFEGLYYIYENGDIWSTRKKRKLKPALNGLARYHYVVITGHNSQNKTISVHALVAHHFLPPKPERHVVLGRYEINHKDHNKQNNHYLNLEWVTHSENIRKARQHHKGWQSGRKSGFNHTKDTKKLMSERKKKATILEGNGIEVNCESIQDAANYLKVSRRTIERYKNSYATCKGFKVRVLD